MKGLRGALFSMGPIFGPFCVLLLEKLIICYLCVNFVNICMLKYINMNCCEIAYCISYALGHPKTVGVSA